MSTLYKFSLTNKRKKNDSFRCLYEDKSSGNLIKENVSLEINRIDTESNTDTASENTLGKRFFEKSDR